MKKFFLKTKENFKTLVIKYKKIMQLINIRNKKTLLWIYLGTVLKSFLDFIGIGIILPLLVALLKPELISQNRIIKGFLEGYSPLRGNDLLVFSAIFIIACYFFKNIYTYFFIVFRDKFIISLNNNLSVRLFKNYLYSPYEFYVNQKKTTLIQNITHEVNQVIDRFFQPVLELTNNLLTILFTLVFLFWLDFSSFFILIFTISLSIYLFTKYSRKIIHSTFEAHQFNNRKKNNYILQALNVFRETKVVGKENFFLNEIKELNNKIKFLDLRIAKIIVTRRIFFETVLILITTSTIIYMILQNQSKEEIVIKMSIFVLSAMRLLPIALDITTTFNEVFASKASIEVVRKDISLLEKQNLKDSSKLKQFKRNIVFENVFFKYDQTDKFVLKNINLAINKGKQIAFVGPSGSGKTTIIDLIIGLLKPTKGSILVDGKSVVDKNDVWTYKIGYIPQDIYITNDTILKNVALGYREEDVNIKRVTQVLKIAQLYDFVMKTEEGLNSFIGENGLKISGGQKQRLGIARALYHRPEILIMDEATAALDNKTEKEFINTLKSLPKSITIIMIAHRLTTVENCDQVIFIHNGEIIDKGTLKELKKNQLFAKEVLGDLV